MNNQLSGQFPTQKREDTSHSKGIAGAVITAILWAITLNVYWAWKDILVSQFAAEQLSGGVGTYLAIRGAIQGSTGAFVLSLPFLLVIIVSLSGLIRSIIKNLKGE